MALQPDLIALDSLLHTIKDMVEDSHYKASRKISDPKQKRMRKHTYDTWYSIHHYLTEFKATNGK
jgi:hypothetical protein